MTTQTQHTVEVSEAKRETVEELVGLLEDHDVIAVAGFRGIPAPQFQQMRANLRELATLRVAKNSLVEKAVEATDGGDGLDELLEHVSDQTVLIASDEDAFTLFRALEGTKTKAPAKGGETAEEDITVSEGETPFEPGPIVGDLQKAGIPAAIEGGSVVIQTDRVVVEAGETIRPEVAQALTRLDIHPVTVGLEFRAALEDGTIFQRDVLDVDVDAYRRDVQAAVGGAFNLAVEIAWETPETAPALVAKAHAGARSLAREAGFLTAETAGEILGEAAGQADAVASRLVPAALDDELRERFGLRTEGEEE